MKASSERRSVVAGNWKMHGTAASIGALLDAFDGVFVEGRADVVLFPPFVYLSLVLGRATQLGAAVGAQNVHAEPFGAFTGEVAAEMIRDTGATHVLVGHSERRHGCGEDDAAVAAKFVGARRAGLVPVLCVGETLDERDAGLAETVVERQLQAVMDRAGVGALAEALVAYEPVWAIGTGRTASPRDAQSMHATIRSIVARLDERVANDLRVLYGGSVKAENATALMGEPDIDGVLVGGASLNPSQFTEIFEAAGR